MIHYIAVTGTLNCMPNRTHIGALPQDQISFRRSMVRHWFKVALAFWGRLGDGKIGMVLLDRYWSGNDPWVTADYVTAALDGLYSDDTVRRRLKQLADNGALLTRKEGRATLYAMRPSVAEEVTAHMEDYEGPTRPTANCGENPVVTRNLRPNLVVVGPYHDS